MKKFKIGVCIWMMVLCMMASINAKSELEYQIQYDSKTTQTYSLKNKTQEIYQKLVEGVHEESYLLMVMHNQDKFAFKENLDVSWEDNTLCIKEGDGKGDQINGVLVASSICVPEVQPRSLLKELFK